MVNRWGDEAVEQPSTNRWGDTMADPADGPKGKEVVSLPKPTQNMFASMDDADAKQVYESYKKHPKSVVNEDGSVMYNGVPVPAPEGNSGFVEGVKRVGGLMMNPLGPIYERLTSPESTTGKVVRFGREAAEGAAGGMAINAPRSVATGGAALASRIPGVGNAPYEYLDENLPIYNPEGTGENIGQLGGEIGAGIIVGNKALATVRVAGLGTQAVQSLSTKLPKVLTYAVDKLVAAAVVGTGTAATVDGKTDTALVGEDSDLAQNLPSIDQWAKSNIPLLRGLKTDDPDSAKAELNARVNVLLDAMIVSLPIDMLADGGKLLSKIIVDRFISPVHGAFSENKKSQIVMETIMDSVGQAVDGDPNSAKALEWKQKVVDILKDPENQEILISSPRAGIDDIKIKRDTTSTLHKGLVDDHSDEAAAVRNVFAENRKSMIDTGGTHVQTKTAAERPVRASETFLEQSQEAFGGDTGIDTARRGIQTEGRKQLELGVRPATEATEQLDEATKNYPKTIRSEGAIDNVVDAPSSSALQDRNKIAGEILEGEKAGSGLIREQKRQLWKDIPDDLPVDEESLNASIEAASEYMTPNLKQRFRKAGVKIVDDVVDAGDDLEDDAVLEALGGMRGAPEEVADFKKVQSLRQPLTKEIDRLIEGNLPGAEELIALRDNITKVQPEFVTKSGVEGADDVASAVAYKKQVQGPVTEQGLPRELNKIRTKAADRFDPAKVDDASRTALHKTLTSDQPSVPTHFAETLARPEYNKIHGKIVDYAMADVAENLRVKIQASGVGAIDPKDVLQSLKPYRQTLNSNPKLFAKELKRLDDFEKSVIANKNNLDELTRIAKEAAADAEKLKKDIYETVLNDFFEKTGVAKPNGYESLKTLYLNPQATGLTDAGKLDEVIDLAKETGDPAVLDGMRAGWLKLVKDKAFVPAPDSAKGKAISAANVSDMLTGENNIFTVGRKLFDGESAPVIDSLEILLDPALDITVAKKGASLKGAADPANINAAKAAVNKAVRLKYGPLTRKGTTINTILGSILEFVNPNDRAVKIGDAILADPDAFVDLYTKFSQKTPWKDKKNVRTMFNWLVKSGIYQESGREDFDKKVKKLNSENQTDEALGK